MDELEQRVARAVEGVLENERLTAELDDAAAQALLAWGVACAETIARSTAGLQPAEAEGAMSSRLSATRRLLRRVNRGVVNLANADAQDSAEWLAELIEQAALVYGEDWTPPDSTRKDAFLRPPADSPEQVIARLRELLDVSFIAAAASPGVRSEREGHAARPGDPIDEENRPACS